MAQPKGMLHAFLKRRVGQAGRTVAPVTQPPVQAALKPDDISAVGVKEDPRHNLPVDSWATGFTPRDVAPIKLNSQIFQDSFSLYPTIAVPDGYYMKRLRVYQDLTLNGVSIAASKVLSLVYKYIKMESPEDGVVAWLDGQDAIDWAAIAAAGFVHDRSASSKALFTDPTMVVNTKETGLWTFPFPVPGRIIKTRFEYLNPTSVYTLATGTSGPSNLQLSPEYSRGTSPFQFRWAARRLTNVSVLQTKGVFGYALGIDNVELSTVVATHSWGSESFSVSQLQEAERIFADNAGDASSAGSAASSLGGSNNPKNPVTGNGIFGIADIERYPKALNVSFSSPQTVLLLLLTRVPADQVITQGG